jgi:hypothetical protein
LLACSHEESYEPDEDDVVQEEVINEKPSPPPAAGEEEQLHDDDFDSCPSDTYVLWSGDGQKYIIEIEVFCDPQPFINVGCPGPGY